MENKDTNLQNALNLYESLDVSDRAKQTFFNHVVLEEAEKLPDETKKAGKFVAFLNGLKKAWGGTQGTVDKMYKALDGMAQTIDASNLTDEQKAEYKKYLDTYKAKIQQNVQAVIAADKAVQDETNKNPNAVNVNNIAKVEKEKQDQLLGAITNAQDVATLSGAITQAFAGLAPEGTDADLIGTAVENIQSTVELKLEKGDAVKAETAQADLEAVTQAMGSANEALRPVFEKVVEAINTFSEDAATEGSENVEDSEGSNNEEPKAKEEETSSSDGASHDIAKAADEKREAQENGKDPGKVEASDDDGANSMDESTTNSEKRI